MEGHGIQGPSIPHTTQALLVEARAHCILTTVKQTAVGYGYNSIKERNVLLFKSGSGQSTEHLILSACYTKQRTRIQEQIIHKDASQGSWVLLFSAP